MNPVRAAIAVVVLLVGWLTVGAVLGELAMFALTIPICAGIFAVLFVLAWWVSQ